MITAPATPRQARPRRPVTTLRPGEAVTVYLRLRADEVFASYGGSVVAVDAVALRLDIPRSRFSPSPSPTGGEAVFPWSRVERITVEKIKVERGTVEGAGR